jgi:hypothetical protein
MSDAAHLRVLGTYVHFAGGLDEPRALDISPRGPGTNDPMFIVKSTRPRRAAAWADQPCNHACPGSE